MCVWGGGGGGSQVKNQTVKSVCYNILCMCTVENGFITSLSRHLHITAGIFSLDNLFSDPAPLVTMHKPLSPPFCEVQTTP